MLERLVIDHWQIFFLSRCYGMSRGGQQDEFFCIGKLNFLILAINLPCFLFCLLCSGAYSTIYAFMVISLNRMFVLINLCFSLSFCLPLHISVCPSVRLSVSLTFFRYHMYIIQIEITLRAPKALPTLSLLLSYAALVHDMNLIYTSSFRGRIIFMVLDFVVWKQVQNHSSA